METERYIEWIDKQTDLFFFLYQGSQNSVPARFNLFLGLQKLM